MSEDLLDRIRRLEKLIVMQSGAVSVSNVAQALKAANATVDDGGIVVPLAAVNDILEAAGKDGVSIVLERMDLDKGNARMVLHGRSTREANDLRGISTIDELSYINGPSNSRCQ